MAAQLLEYDSMVSVGEKPWHGLGTVIPEALRPSEMLKVAKLDWHVSMHPLRLEDDRLAVALPMGEGVADREPTTEMAWKATVRDDVPNKHKAILGIVGPDYRVFQNAQMAALMDPLVDDGKVKIETCGSLFNGRRVWMLARIPGKPLSIAKNDTVDRFVLLAHGHDGRLAARFGWTAVRVVCMNTLSMAIGDKRSQLVRCLHTSSLAGNLELMRNSMNFADEVFEVTAEQYRLLAARGVSKADLLEYARQVIEAPAENPTKGQKRKMEAIVRAAMEGPGNSGKNWWHAYNGVSEYLQHASSQSATSRLNSVWFGEGRLTNIKALELALSLSA